ncbi:MAG: cytochrome c maturation protein CcmE [Acidobacteriales bacterium]|nr:cytochrome c maturation protein CcmE [Terriglobales bacterium]
MSPQARQYVRFAVAISVMVVGLVYLAFTGVQESKSYYVTIQELRTQAKQSEDIYKKRLRVAGNVVPGSIKRRGTRVEFVLKEVDQTLPVIYQGTEAPPDTFKDDSQALAEGTLGRDGVFQAKHLQAKCASKYDAAQQGKATASQTASPSYGSPAKTTQ